MATVNVSSWDEFIQAVSGRGDTVVLPQNAVWDFNDLYPEGVPSNKHGDIWSAKIVGNGTTLKNVLVDSWFFGVSASSCEIEDLRLENFITTGGPLFAVNAGSYVFRRCAFSGLLAEYQSYPACLYNTNGGASQLISCAFTLEAASSRPFRILWTQNTDRDEKKYCRIKLHLPNSSGYAGENTQWSQVNVDCPAQTSLYIGGACANVYGGNLPQVSSVSGSIQSYISVFNNEEIPNLSSTASIIGCTTAQLHDAAYLSSLGFPIGVEA